MAQARTGSFDNAGDAVLSGRVMQSVLGNNRMKVVANELLTMEKRSRLSTIVDELSRLETAQGHLPNIGAVMEDEPNSVVSMIARTIAARTGARAGPVEHRF